jgi:hypothetical protein
VFHDICGAAKARFSHYVPPQCIAGRWGQISRCEDFVQKVDPDDLRAAFRAVAKLRKPVQKPDNLQSKSGLDDMRQEESAAYIEQMSRWEGDVNRGISNDCFFILMQISKKSRGPLDHFLHYLMKTRGALEPTSLARLIWYRQLIDAVIFPSHQKAMVHGPLHRGPWIIDSCSVLETLHLPQNRIWGPACIWGPYFPWMCRTCSPPSPRLPQASPQRPRMAPGPPRSPQASKALRFRILSKFSSLAGDRGVSLGSCHASFCVLPNSQQVQSRYDSQGAGQVDRSR